MGRDAFTQMKSKTSMSRDKNATAMVQRVGRRIAAVADLPKAQWEFVLFQLFQLEASNFIFQQNFNYYGENGYLKAL